MKQRDRLEQTVRLISEFSEDSWFDLTRNVRTSGNVSLSGAGIPAAERQDSELYQPARPAHIRQALRDLPARDLSRFTYVDLGSGKGRTLFVAAEFPFKRIVGVEFSLRLHRQAFRNVRCFRILKRGGCHNIDAVHANAKDFRFPDGDLVLYMFNPFGVATMEAVLANLEQSLREAPRHVIIVLLWPRYGDMVARIPHMQLRRQTRQYQIFEAPAANELSRTLKHAEAG